MTINKQTTIGAFVLGGIILALCAVIFFSNFNLFSKKEHAIIVFPSSISGLSIGAPVTFRGVQVGTVDSINLQFDQGSHKAYIPVVINIDPRKIRIGYKYNNFKKLLEKMIENGLCAEISTESFVTGTSNIFLDFDLQNIPHFHPVIAKNLTEIPSRPSTFQKIKSELMNLQLEQLSRNLNDTAQKIGQLAETLNKQTPDLINSVKKTSDSTNILVTHINKNIDGLLKNFNKLLVDGDVQLRSRGKELHILLNNSNKAVSSASEMIDNVKTLTSSRSPSRNNLEIILKNLADASTSLRGFSREIERNPKLLLIGRKQ
ncbi:MCE family protein [Commensalibacter sp. M0357]|uniref:MlaD family protein n=1 Tax=unclassified Commensalibacter TaxID=2630218 RepID=UPI0018DB87A8|nr:MULTISPECIES: MlaD family protein [unclassified Commensalibacter]MBI0075375.1 MCE family protein [Commensalibacter sp. M0357]MBI0085217.1 MCE family protein [Commensalibacter sp. M0355]